MSDAKLWNAFSLYVRLRDSDENGYLRCITSGRVIHWKEADAGHFISRRHMATKYDERNVNGQSRHDNRFAAGKQYEYGLAIDKKYGKGTSEMLLLKSKMVHKIGKFEIETMTEYYKKKANELLKLKK
jgi:hypothetical protein